MFPLGDHVVSVPRTARLVQSSGFGLVGHESWLPYLPSMAGHGPIEHVKAAIICIRPACD